MTVLSSSSSKNTHRPSESLNVDMESLLHVKSLFPTDAKCIVSISYGSTHEGNIVWT